jgi:hypothetical protein
MMIFMFHDPSHGSMFDVRCSHQSSCLPTCVAAHKDPTQDPIPVTVSIKYYESLSFEI